MTEIAPRKPVIKGTRVPVDLVVGKLAGGMTIEAVADEYGLTRDDVLQGRGALGSARRHSASWGP